MIGPSLCQFKLNKKLKEDMLNFYICCVVIGLILENLCEILARE